MKTAVLYILAGGFAALLSACSQRSLGVNLASETRTESEKIGRGRILFKNNCQRCHPNGEPGEGPGIITPALPGFLTRYRIRSRSFLLWTGKMPSFDHNEIPRKDMNQLIAYINHMRKHRGEEKVK